MTAIVAVLAALQVAAGSVQAHILFADGKPDDIVFDLAINFAVPLVVLSIGAFAGLLLAKWLGHDRVGGDDDQIAQPSSIETSTMTDVDEAPVLEVHVREP